MLEKNDNNENNLNSINIKKNCPYCNMNLSIFQFEDHILCHEFKQNHNGNNSNNINGYGIQKNDSNSFNQPEKEKIPEVLNTFKQKIGNFFDFININKNNTNICDEDNNVNNINNNKNNTNNNNIIINDRNNSNNNEKINNSTNENFSSMINNNLASLNNNIGEKINPVVSKVSNFFKNLINSKNNDSDGNSSGEEEQPIINFIRFRRHRRRSLSDDNIINVNENNENSNADLLLDELLEDNNLFEQNDTQEILRYIPTSIVKEQKKSTDNNNKCVICLSEFQVGEKESTLPCLHIFHSECIEKWIREKKWCPVCKFDISLQSLLEGNNNY